MRQLKFLKAALFVAATVCQGAPQSVSLVNNLQGSFSVPASSPFTALPQWHIDMRLHNFITQPGYYPMLSMVGLRIQNDPATGAVRIVDDADSTPLGSITEMNFAGRTDILLRITRDAVNLKWYVEMWNGDGSNYTISTIQTITSVLSNDYSGSGTLGSSNNAQNIGFFRWFSGVVNQNSAPPRGSTGGDLMDWEFEGNGNDSSPHGINLTFNSLPSYVNTPAYSPFCNAGTVQTFRAGFRATLNGTNSTPLDGGSSLSYFWQQLTGPSSVRWIGSRTAGQAQISGLVFGSYTFQLTVTDSNGQSSTCTVTDGAVGTDANNVVAISNPGLAQVLGPLIQFSKSPWPYFDERHKGWADLLGPTLGPLYYDWWDTAGPGTATFTNNSMSVVGTGTTFRATFCSGTSDPNNTDRQGVFIAGWYPVSGHTGRRELQVAACTDDTHLVLASPWDQATNTMQYAMGRWTGSANVFNWESYGSGVVNVNYYDNVMAYYSLYYRSGISTYLTYARKLADWWWAMPALDEGRGNQMDGQPRGQALTGMYLRALDGRPDMWPGLRLVADRQRALLQRTTSAPSDVREEGYRLTEVALCGILDPDAAHRALCQADVKFSVINEWAGTQRPDGTWWALSNGYASAWNGGDGSATVSVVHGSTTVTGTNTHWTTSSGSLSGRICPADTGLATRQDFATFNFNAATGVITNMDPNPMPYVVSIQDDTHLTISAPFAGATASGKDYQCNPVIGYGVQPFQMGVATTGMHYAEMALRGYDNNAADLAKATHKKMADWILNYGIRPSTNGLWYGRGYNNCEPIGENADASCVYPPDAKGSRELAAEVAAPLAQAYLYYGDSAYTTQGDKSHGGLFGKPINGVSGPYADSNWSSGIDGIAPYTADVGTCQAYSADGYYYCRLWSKYFGFLFGFGNGASYDGSRLGGLAAAVPRTVYVGLAIGSVAGATRVLVSYTRPDGSTAAVSCTASPCAVSLDSREGDHLVTYSYLDGSGRVLSSSTETLIAGVL